MAEMSAQKNAEHLHEELRSLKVDITALLKQLRGMKGIRGLRKKLRDQRREINQFLHLGNTQRLHEALPSLKKPLLQIFLQLKVLQNIHEPVSSLNQRLEGFVVKFLNNRSNAPVHITLREDEEIEPLNKALKEGGCEDVVAPFKTGEHIDTEDAQGMTRLIKAVEQPSEECVKVLLEHGADIYAKSNNSKVGLVGRTALFRANALGYGTNPVAKRIQTIFQQKRKELEAEKIKAAEGPADSPAAKFNKALREAGCEHEVEPLKEGEHIDSKDSQGDTRLLKAAKEGSATCVKILLEHQASLHETNNLGESPLHKAAYKGHLPVVQALIKAGANVNAVDFEGEIPLHEALYKCERDIASLLIEEGSKSSVKNKEGKTPIEIAVDQHCSFASGTRGRRSLEREFSPGRRDETVTIFPEKVQPIKGHAIPGITHMEMQARNNNAVSRVGLDSLAYTGMLVSHLFGLFKAQPFKSDTSTSGSYEERLNRAEQTLKEAEAKYGSKSMR